MVSITTKSTYFKELLFPFFKIFYTLIVHYHVINVVFPIGKQKQLYRETINFESYIHVVYSYNDIVHIFICLQFIFVI